MKTGAGAAYQSGNVLTTTFTHCVDCRHHIKRGIYTHDSFEHEEGIYCSKVPDETESWERHTMGPDSPTNFKLVVADEWDVDAIAKIPDWCPIILGGIDELFASLEQNAAVRQRFAVMQNDESPYDHGPGHTKSIIQLGTELLEAYGGKSYEKDRRLLKIAALLHDLGRPNTLAGRGHAALSAQLAEVMLRSTEALSLTDKIRIIEAINRHSSGAGVTDDPIAAALYFGDKLDISVNRFKMTTEHLLAVAAKTSPRNEEISEFDRQCYRIRELHFWTETQAAPSKENPYPKPDTGVLMFEMADWYAENGPAPEFRPELFSDKEHLKLLTSCRDTAMKLLGLENFEFHVLTRDGLYGSPESKEINIPFEKFMG